MFALMRTIKRSAKRFWATCQIRALEIKISDMAIAITENLEDYHHTSTNQRIAARELAHLRIKFKADFGTDASTKLRFPQEPA